MFMFQDHYQVKFSTVIHFLHFLSKRKKVVGKNK